MKTKRKMLMWDEAFGTRAACEVARRKAKATRPAKSVSEMLYGIEEATDAISRKRSDQVQRAHEILCDGGPLDEAVPGLDVIVAAAYRMRVSTRGMPANRSADRAIRGMWYIVWADMVYNATKLRNLVLDRIRQRDGTGHANKWEGAHHATGSRKAPEARSKAVRAK